MPSRQFPSLGIRFSHLGKRKKRSKIAGLQLGCLIFVQLFFQLLGNRALSPDRKCLILFTFPFLGIGTFFATDGP